MKKILMGSAVLTAFSLSIIAFQMSCSKTANAQTGGTTGVTQLNKIIYTVIPVQNQFLEQIWIANYDGTNPKQVPITLPTNVWVDYDGARLSPDGKTVFFSTTYAVQSGNSYSYGIYSCGVDGSNLTKIVNGTSSLNGAY